MRQYETGTFEENVFDKQTLVVFGFGPQGLQHQQMFEGYRGYTPTEELLDISQRVNKVRDIYTLPNRRLAGGELTASANATAYAAAFIACRESGLLPDVVFGVSWGESGALMAAGSIDPLDMPQLGKDRGHETSKVVKSLMRNRRHTTGMALVRAVKGRAEHVEMPELLDTLSHKVTSELARRKEEFVKVTNRYNTGSNVVGGFRYLIDDLEDRLPDSLFLKKIDVDGAYHTEVMDPAVEPFSKALDKYEFCDPTDAIVISPTTKGVINSREDAINVLTDQLVEEVDLIGMTERSFKPQILGSIAATQVLFFELSPSPFKPGMRTNKGTTIDAFLPTLGGEVQENNVRKIRLGDRNITVISGRISTPADLESDHIKDMMAELKKTELTR